MDRLLGRHGGPPGSSGRIGPTRISPKLFWGASFGAAIVLGLVLHVDLGAAPTVCLFRLTIGLPCPGCGLTRAAAALVGGDLAGSVGFHPLALLLAAEGLAIWVSLLVAVHRGRPLLLPPGTERWVMAHAAMLVALWLGRTASGTLPF